MGVLGLEQAWSTLAPTSSVPAQALSLEGWEFCPMPFGTPLLARAGHGWEGGVPRPPFLGSCLRA